MSTIHFVGGEKGGVGKSVVARLLSQYFLDNNKPYCGLDADRSHPTLSRYYGEFTAPVDLDEFESIDQIIELASAEEDRQILIDLPAQSQRFLDRWIDDNGVFELCTEMQIPIVFWHLVDGGRDSMNLLQKFIVRYRDHLNCVVVKNGGCGKDFSELESIPLLLPEGADHPELKQIYIPAFHEGTLRKIDKLQMNFWAAGNLKEGDSTLGMMERQRTRVWLKKCYSAFDDALGGIW